MYDRVPDAESKADELEARVSHPGIAPCPSLRNALVERFQCLGPFSRWRSKSKKTMAVCHMLGRTKKKG